MNSILLSIILVPIIEIYLLIKIGSKIGAFYTISLILTTAVVGGTGGVAPGLAVGTVNTVVKSVLVMSTIALLNVLAKEKTLRFCFFF